MANVHSIKLNSSHAIGSGSVQTDVFKLASENDPRHAFALVMGITVAVVALSSSKIGQEVLTFVYHTFNHLLGGAPRTVGLPGPIGYPLAGNLYQVITYFHSKEQYELTVLVIDERWSCPNDQRVDEKIWPCHAHCSRRA